MAGRNHRAATRFLERLRVALAVEAAESAYYDAREQEVASAAEAEAAAEAFADAMPEAAPQPRRWSFSGPIWYRLEGRTPVACDRPEGAAYFEGADDARRVGASELGGDVFVSTVFLALDHSHGRGPPVLFETMVFYPDPYGPKMLLHGQASDREGTFQVRYRTYDEAEEGHARVVALVERQLEVTR